MKKYESKYYWAQWSHDAKICIIEMYGDGTIHCCGSDEALKRSDFDVIGQEITKPDLVVGITINPINTE